MSNIVHDCIVAFFFVLGLISGYGIVMWWVNWFYSNFRIIKKNNKEFKQNGNND